jgi:hypothetical protein
MRRFAVASVVAVALVGCAAPPYNPIPKGYSGPLATVLDSVTTHSESKADFFVVSHVDGQQVEQSLVTTRLRNQGRGSNMTPVLVQREVPTGELQFTILGRTAYAAPILCMMNPVYRVKGDVRFTPMSGRTYVVRGTLDENYSAVWIEEQGKEAIPGTKIEFKGSTKLGFFELEC